MSPALRACILFPVLESDVESQPTILLKRETSFGPVRAAIAPSIVSAVAIGAAAPVASVPDALAPTGEIANDGYSHEGTAALGMLARRGPAFSSRVASRVAAHCALLFWYVPAWLGWLGVARTQPSLGAYWPR